MESILPVRKLFSQLKKLFWVWLVLAVLAGIVTLLVFNLTKESRGQVSAVVSYSYNGIESGNDPSGNRFDPAEIKEDAVVQAAIKAAELDSEEYDIASIQNAITVSGRMPDGIMRDITKYDSVFKNDTISSKETVRKQSYFPTQYTVSFDYSSVGMNGGQGAALLEKLLDCYEKYFYDTYSFSSIGKSVQALNYEDYDYEDATKVLDTKLLILRNFASKLADLDNSRFTSKETGYTFSDLVDAVDTIRNEDIMRVTSYISSFNLTKSKPERINYYSYKIDNEGRIQAQLQEMISTLDSLINGFQKTTAVVSGYVGSTMTGEEGETILSYEITQPSETYDALVDQRIDYRTRLSESKERTVRYQERLEQIENEESGGNIQVVEEILGNADQKIDELLMKTSQTANEFYNKEYLKRAFQVLPSSDSFLSSVKSLISSAMHKGFAVEAFLFGLYLLCAIILALLSDKTAMASRIDQALARTSPRKREKETAESGGRKHNAVSGGR